jgi:hypothetical protein
MGVQREKNLAVGTPAGEQVSGMYCEGALADACHSVYCINADNAAIAGDRVDEPGEFGLAAGELADVPRQVRRDSSDRRPLKTRLLILRSRIPIRPPRRCLECQAVGTVKAKRVSQEARGVPARCLVDPPLEIADPARAHARSVGKFFLGEPGLSPQFPEKLSETH